MKTKFYFLVISLLAICSVCLPACDNDEKGDVTKPVIDLIEPEEGAVLKIGNEKGVHFEMNLSDDVMLKSYKINIHNNFDHHGHDSRAAGQKNIAFTFDKVYDVSGLKNTKVHHHDIAEFYQFNLSSCIRQQNSLTAQFVSFSLSNLANIFYPPPNFYNN